VVFKWLMASRRAYADEYAVRVNRAVELLVDLSPADASPQRRSWRAGAARRCHEQIVERLVISPRTAADHLEYVYAKIDGPTRTQPRVRQRSGTRSARGRVP
jgi:hypothetical protein